MRKLKFLFSLLMLICFSVGQGWAQASKGATLFSEDFSGYSANDVPSGSVTAATGRVVYGDASVTYACTDGDGSKPGATKIYNEAVATGTAPEILVGKYGSGGSTGGSFSIAGIPSGDAKEITVTYKQNKQKLKVAVSGTGYSSAGYDAKPADVGEVSFDITVGDGAASTFTLTFSAYSSNVRVDDIVVTVKTAGGSSTTPSFDASPAAVEFGNVLENTETDGDPYVRKEVTLEGANLTDKVYLELNNGFKIYDPTKAAGNVLYMSLTPNASGVIDTTIIVEMYTKQTGTFNGTLSITSEKSTPEFTEIEVPLSINLVGAVTSYDIDFEAGMMDVYTNWNFSNIACVSTAITAHGGTYYGNTGGKSTASITTKSKVALPGTLTFYISKESTNTTASSWVAQVSSDGSIWTDVETFDAKAMDKGVWNECTADLSEYSNVYVRISYGSSSAIRAIDDISLAMRTPAAVENPSISGKTPFYKTTTVTIECVTEGAEIHYTTDGSEPTGGDNTYHNPFEISATKTVKAIAIKGVDVSEVVSKTFTKADAITVTAAIALIPNADDAVADQFVEGYVCTVGTSVSSGQMTYYISADGTETNRLQVFKGKALNNADFTSAEDLAIGDKVVVYGELKNYNGTPEMNSGNYIVEKVAKGDVQSVVISGEATHGAYEGGDAFDPAGLTVTATYASGFQEDVTASATWSPATITTQSGNTDVTASFGGKTSAAKTVNISLNKYTVTFNTSVYGGTWGIQKAGEPISSGNYFPKGTVLTVVTNPVAGYALGSITVNDEPLVGNEITIGTENITVAVEFAMVQEGVLVLSTNSLNWGTINKGTSPLSVPFKTFTLAGSNLTEGRTVTLTTPDWCHLTQTTANPTAGGNIATTSFYVYVNDATLNAAGEYSGNIVISSDDLTADSLIAVSLNVVEATPSISVKDVYAQDITSIDFGNVDKGASVSQFNISLVGHNLTGDVKVTVANATSTNVFVTNGFKPSNTYYQSGGEIDAAVYVIPFTSTGGEFNGTITFHSESGDFDDIVIPLHINIKPDAGLEWSAATATAYTKAKPYELPTLTNPHDVTVAYSGNNDDVATVNAATGEVTLVAAGEVTITASFAGNGDYVAQEVEYTLTVKAPTGLRLSGEMTTKEYEEGDHVSVDGYTVEAVFGSPYDYYDVTNEATWKLDGVDIATKTVTSTSEYTIEATWEGFTAWGYVNLVRKTHAVNFNDPEHGTLTVTVFGGTFISGAKFKKGTEVIISINPAVGYEGAVTVNGEPLVGNSYTIGTEDITIVATFNEVTIPKHTVTFTNGINGTFQVKKDGEAISSGNQYAEGTEFTIWTNPAKDYKVGAITINGEPIEGTSFVMGSEDIEVGVSFVLKPEPNLGWSSTSDVYAYTDNGKSYTMPTLVNPDNLDITFTTTTSVATVNADGTINLIGSGFTLVQINFAGNDTYRSAYPHFRLWVCAPKSMYISEVSTHKSSYNYGEAFDFTGLKATLVYDNNGGDRDVTSEAEWTSNPATVTMDGDYTITAAYGDIQGTKSLYASVKAYPSIDANRTSIDFGEVIKGSASWPSQELTITGANLTAAADATALATGGGAVFYIEDKSYVRLTPVEGSINATVSISANPNLPVGEYNGSVKIESIAATADFEPIYVDLHMTIVSNATALDNVETEEPASKILLNNQLFIIRDGKMFDASGALVK